MDKEQKESPSRAFLKKLYAKLKELAGDKLPEDDFNAAVAHARAHAGGVAKAEKARTAGEESLTDMIEKVSRALTRAFLQPLTREAIFYWPKEVYLDRVIACSSVDGKYFEIPYTIDGDEVTFGEPVEVEETYRPVGMNELSSLCAKGHGSRLFMEASFAEPPEWMPFLPKPGEFKHPVYGEIVITKERNENFVTNFEAGVYQEKLPVDAEHETKLSGAVGWITGMRVNDDGSADAKVEWTDRGVSLIESDRFAYVSPEWYDVWTEPASGETHENIAIGAALTTRPFFKEGSLRPLIASERGLEALDEGRTNFQTHTYHFAALAPSTHEGAPKTMAEEKPEGAATAAPPKEEAQQFAEMQSSLTAAEQRAEKAEGEVKQMGERIASLEKEGRTRRFNDRIKSGNWLGKPEDHLALMETLGEGSDALKVYEQQQDAIAAQAKDGKLFAEIGSSLEGEIQGALAELEKKAKELQAAEPNLSYALAYDRAMTENPDLVRKQREEAKGAK